MTHPDRASVDELPKTATGKIQKHVLRGGVANIARH
jgi:acyl-coenzyme A synthetase/AMP-(fatty) acid ligase